VAHHLETQRGQKIKGAIFAASEPNCGTLDVIEHNCTYDGGLVGRPDYATTKIRHEPGQGFGTLSSILHRAL